MTAVIPIKRVKVLTSNEGLDVLIIIYVQHEL